MTVSGGVALGVPSPAAPSTQPVASPKALRPRAPKAVKVAAGDTFAVRSPASPSKARSPVSPPKASIVKSSASPSKISMAESSASPLKASAATTAPSKDGPSFSGNSSGPSKAIPIVQPPGYRDKSKKGKSSRKGKKKRGSQPRGPGISARPPGLDSESSSDDGPVPPPSPGCDGRLHPNGQRRIRIRDVQRIHGHVCEIPVHCYAQRSSYAMVTPEQVDRASDLWPGDGILEAQWAVFLEGGSMLDYCEWG